MDITLEQSLASAVRYIIDNDVEGVHPYFEEIPEQYYVPSVYFPVPYAEGRKVTLQSYRNTITFDIRILAGTDWDAESRAASLRDALMLDGLAIPVYDKTGAPTGKSLRIQEPYQRRYGDRTVILTIPILDYFTPEMSRTMANNIIIAWNKVVETYTQEVNDGE